jgi:hypothetical protein
LSTPVALLATSDVSQCNDPNALIFSPQDGTDVRAPFQIIGTATGTRFAAYRVEIASVDVPIQTGLTGLAWHKLSDDDIQLRVENNLLVPEMNTEQLMGVEGKFALQLTVIDTRGNISLCKISLRLLYSSKSTPDELPSISPNLP